MLLGAASSENQLLEIAITEAGRLNSTEVLAEHVLLALVGGNSAAGQVLRDAGVTHTGLVQAITERGVLQGRTLASSSNPLDLSQPKLTPKPGVAIVQLTKVAARNDPHYFALLQAMLDEPTGSVKELLESLGVPPATVKARLLSPAHTSLRPVARGRILAYFMALTVLLRVFAAVLLQWNLHEADLSSSSTWLDPVYWIYATILGAFSTWSMFRKK